MAKTTKRKYTPKKKTVTRAKRSGPTKAEMTAFMQAIKTRETHVETDKKSTKAKRRAGL